MTTFNIMLPPIFSSAVLKYQSQDCNAQKKETSNKVTSVFYSNWQANLVVQRARVHVC